MKIVSYNIQYGTGVDGKVDLERIAGELEGADIIGLQEVDRFWKRNGNVDQAAELADLLGGYRWVYGPGLDMDASFHDENGKLVNRRRQHGEMILSKYPIISTRTYPLPKMGSITRHAIQAALLEAVIDAPGGPLRVYNTHLFYWSPDFALVQARFVRDRIKTAPSEGGAWCGGPGIDAHWLNDEPQPTMPTDCILLGDMNNGPGTPVYEVFTGPPSEEGGRVQTLDGFVDPWVWLGNEETSGKTAHFDTRRIDHLFVSASLRHRIAGMRVDEDAKGSDHLPVWLELKDA
ncbi:endonuclease/exonuclease/phosphatase family protein [Pseudovibrio ascidiaceicola]|uniref:endonuclease/exonuclease/phosphatase family protein n=1 Tax=Pseudovibrio ascidiaceicola TaxID=285279 RepID=UPI000D69C37A|nr:endonuclease/exonuclease/phosphatase family protein [Pseudovibrio ascidiaceicola]